MITICANCRFFIQKGSIWYDQLCGRSERQEAIDPVTGKRGWVGQNDFGMKHVSDQQFDYARDVNHGSCVMYEEK